MEDLILNKKFSPADVAAIAGALSAFITRSKGEKYLATTQMISLEESVMSRVLIVLHSTDLQVDFIINDEFWFRRDFARDADVEYIEQKL